MAIASPRIDIADLPRLDLPRFVRVRQHFPRESVADIDGAVREALQAIAVARRVRPGMRVAIAAGSRGIAAIDRVVGALGRELRALGAEPFVIPAMGSHGGATAEGQAELLASLGIDEKRLGIPVRSSMETVVTGRTATGAEVHMDRLAYESDGVVVVNRVKAHTAFRAPIESGLCKMLTIGLGKQRGAESAHSHNLKATIPQAAEIQLATGKILFGLAIVENAYHAPYRLEAVPPDRFLAADADLLTLANSLLPRVPFDPLDVLVVQWMGKNISGSGMDFNVIGMWRRIGGEQRPYFGRIVVLDLTPESHGNGLGVGTADFTTLRLVEKLDLGKVYMNALTANFPGVARIPITLPDDRTAIEVALKSSSPNGPPRVAVIRSTLELEELLASEALLPEIAAQPRLEVLSEPAPLQFDDEGVLRWP